MKKVICLAALAYMSSTFGQVSEIAMPSFQDRFSMDLFMLTDTSRDEFHRVNGFGTSMDLTGSYRINGTWKTRLRLGGDYEKETGKEAESAINSAQLHLSGFGLLKQKQHGLNLGAEIRASYTTHDDLRRFYGSYGEQSLRLYPGWRVSKSFKINTAARYYVYLLNQYKNPYSYKNRRRIDITPAYSFNRNWQLSINTEYSFINKYGENMTEEYLDLLPILRYRISSDLSVSASADYRLMKSFDDQTFSTDAWRRGSYAVGLFARLF